MKNENNKFNKWKLKLKRHKRILQLAMPKPYLHVSQKTTFLLTFGFLTYASTADADTVTKDLTWEVSLGS